MKTADGVPDVARPAFNRLDGLTTIQSSLLVLVVLLCVYLPTATTDFRINTDTAMAALPAWQLVEHGTLDISEHHDFLVGRPPALAESREIGDALYSGRNPGAIFWAVPFYALASPFTGAEPFPVWPAAVAAATAAALAMTFLHVAFRRLLSPTHATVAALVAGTATSTWSVSADALWTHGPAQLWITIALVFLAGNRLASSGAALGAALFTRPYTAFAAAATGTYLSLRRRNVVPALRIAATSLIGVAALLLYTRLMFGRWSILGGYYVFEESYIGNVTGATGGDGFLDRLSFHASRFLRALVDPDQGLFVYSPCLVLLLPGLRLAWRQADSWVRAAALGGVAHLVTQVLVNGWFGGDFFFGNRYSLEAMTLWAPLLAVAWREYVLPDRARVRLVAALIAVNIAWMAYGAAIEPYKG